MLSSKFSIERDGIYIDCRLTDSRPFSGREIHLEYFMFTEMHFSGCGKYSSRYRWVNATVPAFEADIMVRKHQNVPYKAIAKFWNNFSIQKASCDTIFFCLFFCLIILQKTGK